MTTLFETMLKRVPSSMCLSPSPFICFCPAEIKMSHSAPCSIWVLSVPLESKLYTILTSGATFLYISAILFIDSVIDAAANTESSVAAKDFTGV